MDLMLVWYSAWFPKLVQESAAEERAESASHTVIPFLLPRLGPCSSEEPLIVCLAQPRLPRRMWYGALK